MRTFSLLCVVWTTMAATTSDPDAHPVRDTTYGKVQGYVHTLKDGRTIERYLGVPYATPPVADRRFELPSPPERWTHIRSANKPSVACMQHMLDVVYVREHAPDYSGDMSEDCLYLNVYVPTRDGSSRGSLPVLVHVHGGSNEVGTGDMFHGDVLASYGQMVVVTFNYRLGAFGFLRIPQLNISGNFGLYDQVLAFKWVNENIASFGGDPTKVTVQGHSAGSIDVSLHVLSPLSKGLFRYAILQSGAPTSYWAVLPEYDPQDQSKGSSRHVIGLGCSHTDKIKAIACLKNVSATRISTNVYHHGDGLYIFAPSIDGKFLVDYPRTLLSQVSSGTVNAESLLLGVVKDEGSLTADVMLRNERMRLHKDAIQHSEAFDDELFKNFPSSVLDLYRKVHHFKELTYFTYKPWKDPGNTTANYMALSDLAGDITFTVPTIQTADYLSTTNDTEVYVYRFEHRSQISSYPDWMGVPHGEDLFYLFGCPVEGHPVRNYTDLDRVVSLAMIDLWSNFVKYGRPSIGLEKSSFQTYGAEKNYIHIASNETHVVISNQQRMRGRFMAYWQYLLPNMEELPRDPTSVSNLKTIMWVLIGCLCVTVTFSLSVILCLGCKGRSQKLVLKQSGKPESGVLLS